MARVDITEQKIGAFGELNPVVFAAGNAADDHRFRPGKNQILLVRNGGATNPVVVTIQLVPDEAGRTGTIEASIAAGAFGAFGPFSSGFFKQRTGADAGHVQVNLDQDDTVTLALLEARER